VTTSPVICRLRAAAEPDSPHVLFFPFGGGNSWSGRLIEAALPTGYGLSAVQYPGRGPRINEPHALDVTQIAESVLAELGPTGGPTLFFGHSLGALIAFETARLHREGSIDLLIVSAARPPGMPESDDSSLDDESLTKLMVAHGGTPEDVLRDPELMGMMLPVMRADYRLAGAYRPYPPPVIETPIVAIGGDTDPTVPPELLALWQRHTRQWLGALTAPGGHFYLQQELDAVAEALRQCELSAAGRPGSA
jgi:surfactin synthase thioesterase subunit